MRLCCNLQTPQPLSPQARRQPRQHRAHMAAFQSLLQRPQTVGARNHPRTGVDDQQRAHVKAQRRQGLRRQLGRRVKHHHQTAAALGGRQTRRQQANFTHARMRQQQLGEHPARPATAGQLRVQQLEAAGHGSVGVAPQLMAQPQRGVQGFGRSDRFMPTQRGCRLWGHQLRHFHRRVGTHRLGRKRGDGGGKGE